MIVAMIWRPQPGRERAHRLATQFWEQLGPIEFFDSGHEIFNRAASRNMAVRWAAANGHDRLIITDADTIADPHAVTEAWNETDSTAVHLPYTICRVYNMVDELVGQFDFTCGGVYVTTPEAWSAAGGQDERFDRWAPEDMAFKLAHETLLGPMRRHVGVLASLGHPVDPNRHTDDPADELVRLYRRYEAANGNREEMRNLCFPSTSEPRPAASRG